MGHLGGFACTVPYERLAQKMKKTRDIHSWINPLNRRTKAQNWQRWVAEQPVVNVQDNLCGCQTMMQQLSWFSSACFRNFDALLAAQVQCVPGMRHSVVAFVCICTFKKRPRTTLSLLLKLGQECRELLPTASKQKTTSWLGRTVRVSSQTWGLRGM